MSGDLLNIIIIQYQSKLDDIRSKQQEIAGILNMSVASILVLLGVSIQFEKDIIIAIIPVIYIFSMILSNVRLCEIFYTRSYLRHLQDEITKLVGVENIFQQTSSSLLFDEGTRPRILKSRSLFMVGYIIFFGIFAIVYIFCVARVSIFIYEKDSVIGLIYIGLMVILPITLIIGFLKGAKILKSFDFANITKE